MLREWNEGKMELEGCGIEVEWEKGVIESRVKDGLEWE